MKVLIFYVCAISALNYYVEATTPTKVQCGGTTSAKLTNLLSPDVQNTNCIYTIKPVARTCQVRIDFDIFTLAAPRIETFPECFNDIFEVEGFPSFLLCGENAGQHIYLTHNTTQINKPLVVKVKTAIRSSGDGLVEPKWSIRVTQLVCAVGAPLLAIESPIEELTARTTGTDGYLMAPIGCLQYYPDEVGVFESFNFNNGDGVYIGNQRYAICFRRTSSTRGVILKPTIFAMGRVASAFGDIELACYSDRQENTDSEDHLFLPYSEFVNKEGIKARASRYCDSSIEGLTIEVTPPGPLAIYFNSDRQYLPAIPETGFRIGYNTF